MALFNCKDCGGKVSTAARFCPHCGRVVSLDDIYTGIKRNKRTYRRLLLDMVHLQWCHRI